LPAKGRRDASINTLSLHASLLGANQCFNHRAMGKIEDFQIQLVPVCALSTVSVGHSRIAAFG